MGNYYDGRLSVAPIMAKAAAKRRKGVSLVEAMILILVLAITMGAMFATMAWASRTYSFGRQDSESRQVLFRWVQTFESLWQPASVWPPFDPNTPNARPSNADLNNEANTRIAEAGGILGVWDGTNNRAQIGSYSVEAIPAADTASGMMNVTITVSAGNRILVGPLVNRFNTFASEFVEDIDI